MDLVFQRRQRKALSFVGDFYYNGAFVMVGVEALVEGNVGLAEGRYPLKMLQNSRPVIGIMGKNGIPVGYLVGTQAPATAMTTIKVGIPRGSDLITSSDKVLASLMAKLSSLRVSHLTIRNPLV